MSAARHLLVRGVNWLGDAVMTTPALLRLREALPDTRVTLLAPAKLGELWQHHPAVDEVLTFSAQESPWSLARRLRTHPTAFDHALILPNSPRSALEAFLAGIPRRTGFRRPWRNWLLTDPVPPRPAARRMHKPSPAEIARRLADSGAAPAPLGVEAHHSLDYLHLAAALGACADPVAPRLAVLPREVDAVRAAFGLDPAAAWLGLNPGAEYGPAKRWPADAFAAAAAAVTAVSGSRWIVFGGPNDTAVAAGIADRLPGAVNLAGRTGLRQLMAAISVCRVLLTNDTGPMHVAAALGVPVVVPFGSTSPELTGPGLPGDPRHRLLRAGVACAPCFLRECPIDLRCLRGITVERVTAEVRGVLGTARDP